MSTKRAVQLASKLQHEENARLRLLVFAWAEESESWAKDMMSKYGPNNAQKDEAGFRLLYILNHYCPALHHFHRSGSVATYPAATRPCRSTGWKTPRPDSVTSGVTSSRRV